ncbi:MAG: hypothetical protein AB1725_09620, partial [Armatimonadota bacterium]
MPNALIIFGGRPRPFFPVLFAGADLAAALVAVFFVRAAFVEVLAVFFPEVLVFLMGRCLLLINGLVGV